MKKFWKSKTLWFNFLTVLLAIASHFGYTPDPTLTDLVSRALIVLSPLVNIGLRAITKEEVGL